MVIGVMLQFVALHTLNNSSNLFGSNLIKMHTGMLCVHSWYNAISPESKFEIDMVLDKFFIPFKWLMHLNNQILSYYVGEKKAEETK